MENEDRLERDKKQLNDLSAQKGIRSALGILPVWSGSSLCTLWVAKDPNFLLLDGEDWSDCRYTGW